MRQITHHTSGHRHGPILRLMSPSDLGEVVKPFVFLDLFDLGKAVGPGFAIHPHSGIATLTYMLRGDSAYEDTTGKRGELKAGGVEWMQAGGGVWHHATPVGEATARGFQLWMALPPELENAPAESIYIAPEELQKDGPATVLLGSYGSARSLIPPPSSATYLAVHLEQGEHWRFEPPAGQDLAWLAVGSGGLKVANSDVGEGELVVFEESHGAIDLQATGPTMLVLGSAAKHPHDLVMGMYSVHTTPAALRIGEDGIKRIGQRLRAEGRI